MQAYELNWKSLDPEAKWGLPAEKFTGVNAWFSFVIGIVFTLVFYGILFPFWRLQDMQMIDMFFHGGEANRSTIPYYTVFLAMWCLAFLLIKWRKLQVQRKALAFSVVPDEHGFLLSPENSVELLHQIDLRIYKPEGFVVINRIRKALSNLKNMGRVSDVSSVLGDLAIADEKYTESTYTLPKGLIWAIPVTGFIGTVLGLSSAVGGFGAVVSQGADIEVLKDALSGVTGGLAVAFETTLIALVAALIIQLLMTLLIRKEEAFLDECSSYCYDNVISKLKIIDIKDDVLG